MNQVSVIGLGPMGIALARTLLRGGARVTVWNRTSAKAEPLVAEGAALAASVAAAAQASPVVIVCVADYPATRRLLEAKEVAAALAGKVLVQLSTGTPEDARQGEAWARQRGVDYLDGAILAIPSQMGKPESTIIVSGSETAFQRSKPHLEAMAGTVTYLGGQVGSASAMDLAVLSYLFGGLLGFYHGARICEVEGLRVADLGAMLAGIAPAFAGIVNHDADVIESGKYGNPESSIETCMRAADLFVRQAREARLDDAFPAFAAGLFKRGMEAGYGDEGSAALVKVMRQVA